MQRVLITGINGFIGQALSQAIRANGYEVWGIDITSDLDRHVIGANLLDRNEVSEVSDN